MTETIVLMALLDGRDPWIPYPFAPESVTPLRDLPPLLPVKEHQGRGS